MARPLISIIIPALNEAGQIAATLQPLQTLRGRGHEVIVVDGGSSDATVEVATPLADRVLSAPPGRASQQAVGVSAVRHGLLWLLHADTAVPPNSDALIRAALERDRRGWGHFNVRLSGRRRMFRVIEWFINRRSCLTGVATGDQGIFVQRDWLAQIGGIPQLPLMEDVALSKRLRRMGRGACIPVPLVTSSRRWEEHGVWRTIVLMWGLRLGYVLGVSPQRLARYYRYAGKR